MLTVYGFNGFGQLGADLSRKITCGEGIDLTALDVDGKCKVLAVAAWHYAAFATGCKLFLQGLLLQKPNVKLSLNTIEPVKQLAACDQYCLVLLQNGQLLKVVPNADCSLQEVKFAHLEDDIERLPKKRSIFGKIRSNPSSFKITHIACGSKLACAVSDKNGIYNIPSRIHQLEKHMRIQQLVCGFEHAMLLTTNGDIYAWGNGIRGQLGLEPLGLNEIPILIEALAGIKINYIAAGGWHSAAISAFGDLYTWGFNPNGQLGLKVYKDDSGLKNPLVYTLPQLVHIQRCCHPNDSEDETSDVQHECMPLKVYSGSRHIMLQLSCGAIFASGWNAHGQLALNRKIDFVDQFRKVDLDTKNIDVTCSDWCTFFFNEKK